MVVVLAYGGQVDYWESLRMKYLEALLCFTGAIGVVFLASLIFTEPPDQSEAVVTVEESPCKRTLAERTNRWRVYRWECTHNGETHVFYGDDDGFTSVVVK